jgi:predicted nucleotidyltransferase
MHREIADRRAALADLCRRHGVARLEVFGSAARATDFDPALSDADFLVTFAPATDAAEAMSRFFDFQAALEALLGRPVDLVERPALETSRNYLRRRAILAEAEPVYGA